MKITNTHSLMSTIVAGILLLSGCNSGKTGQTVGGEISKPRVIVTSDGEIDDECSLVRFLLYANEWNIEGIVTSSSQYHWHGHKWAGDDWMEPTLKAYAEVYPNLVKHDPDYPTPEYLRQHCFLGNVALEGEMDSITAGSQHIVKILLDETDNRPICMGHRTKRFFQWSGKMGERF